MKKPLNVTIDKAIIDRFKAFAVADHRSVSNMLEVILLDYLQNRENPKTRKEGN